jgi:hypothetical protein
MSRDGSLTSVEQPDADERVGRMDDGRTVARRLPDMGACGTFPSKCRNLFT